MGKKRFTESEKWMSAWFSNLENKYKLLWFYLLDTCDHAGIWQCNLPLAEFQIGESFDIEEIDAIFGDRIVMLSEDKWLLTGFIKFQYKTLKDTVSCHKSVMDILISEGLYEHYPNSFKTLKDKYKGKGQYQTQGEDQSKGNVQSKDTESDKEEDMNEKQAQNSESLNENPLDELND